jgi:hypothetical protein
VLDVNAELGTATVRVDLSEVTEATAPVVTAARLAVSALIGQVFAERLLGLDISPTRSYLEEVAIPDRNPVTVHVSFAGEPGRLLEAVRPTEWPVSRSMWRCLTATSLSGHGGEWSGLFVSGGPRSGPSIHLDD